MSKSRKTNPQPYAATVAPVRAYCDMLEGLHRKPWHVITIPEGSFAWHDGGRYAAVSDDDLQSYVAAGAALVPA